MRPIPPPWPANPARLLSPLLSPEVSPVPRLSIKVSKRLQSLLSAAVTDEDLVRAVKGMIGDTDARVQARGVEIFLRLMHTEDSSGSPAVARLNLRSVLSGSRDSAAPEAQRLEARE